MCCAWRNYVSSWSYNYYYGPLYGQGLAPDYLPGRDQAAFQRQPVNTVTLDTGTGTRSSSHNEPSHLASITLKVINPANKKDMNFFIETFMWQRDATKTLRGDCETIWRPSATCKVDVGYLWGQKTVWIMTDDDLIDAWSTLSEGTGSLW